MERDFMGLNSAAESMAVVKEEIVDVANDSGFTKGPGMQWPFLNKVPSLPHFMSFKASHEDKQKRVVSVDSFDHTLKLPTGEVQKTFNFNQDRQGGTHFSMASHTVKPEQHNTIHRPHDANKMLPVSNTSMINPFFKTHFSSSATAKPQLVGGNYITTALHSLPSTGGGSVAGFTDLWNNSKPSGSPAQLTIFFAGTVNVFDDISPEKAQAIMSLATNAIHQRSQFQLPNVKLAINDGVGLNHNMNTNPASNLSSPILVSSHTGAVSGSGSNNYNELLQAVPQARKASLARFLEKRKERVMSTAAPYELSKKSPECATPA